MNFVAFLPVVEPASSYPSGRFNNSSFNLDFTTKNGRIFGEQTLEEMPKKYRDTVIRNKAIRERNEKYMQARAKRRSVIQAALDASAKPRRPWTAPPGVNRIFSQVPPLRPPTDQENKKIAKF